MVVCGVEETAVVVDFLLGAEMDTDPVVEWRIGRLAVPLTPGVVALGISARTKGWRKAACGFILYCKHVSKRGSRLSATQIGTHLRSGS